MSAEDEIRPLEEELRQADARDAPDTSGVFERLFAPDVLLVGAGGTFPLSMILDGHRPPHRRRFSEVRVSNIAYRALGELVAVVCRTDYVSDSGTFPLRTVRLWRRRDGQWKVVLVALMAIPKE